MRTRWAVLISGNGSTLGSLLDCVEIQNSENTVAVVIASKAAAYGVLRARRLGVSVEIIPEEFKGPANRERAEEWIFQTLRRYHVKKVFLAGYMRLVSEKFVQEFEGHLYNIHPSLLPKHKGIESFQRALDEGDTEAGVSIHHVTAEMDSGQIILQRSFEIPHHRETQLSHLYLHIQEQRVMREALRKISGQRFFYGE